MCLCSPLPPPPPLLPIPTARQLTRQRAELAAFFYVGMNTFTDREWGTGREDPRLFDPAALNATQWVDTVKAAGFQAPSPYLQPGPGSVALPAYRPRRPTFDPAPSPYLRPSPGPVALPANRPRRPTFDPAPSPSLRPGPSPVALPAHRPRRPPSTRPRRPT
ncbi:unnamed protein product [Closterium sp. NIES-64]|nr:unnamed protein product [Closterium sp. NIES-64]